VGGLANIVPLAAEDSGGGSFLVSPKIGLMIWTLLAFGITLYLLNRLAFPRIAEALDRRRKAIEDSIEHA
jgi:F-type H+-transporting ATPase subunit b